MQTTVTETQQQVEKLVGKSLKRKEDLRFLLGASRFVDDIKLPGMLHAFVVRSPYAHAKINSINLREALSSPGVHHIYTARGNSRPNYYSSGAQRHQQPETGSQTAPG